MSRKTIVLMMLIFTLVAPPFASFADEGMWLPDRLDKLPLAQLKKKGFELKPEEVYSTANPSLKDAVVQISIGGTGSFVSPEGLIVTNHHVAFGAVTRASTTEKDYINNGFLAKARGEEIPAQGYTISITQEYKDVTSEVLSAVKPEMSNDDRTRAITAKQQEIAKTALAGRDKEGIRTQVVLATGGYQYFLYTYLTVRDIRLVYAPPKSIGYFGGDPDNFEWPRHCGDFAFLRAYVGADGKPANFSKDNVPFKPKKFLTINAGGIKEGDFAMVMGYPGSTYRYRESYSIEYNQNVQLPTQIALLRQQIETLTKLGEKDPALKIRFAEQIFGLSNSLKSFEGNVAGLKRMKLVERRRAEEAEFAKWLDTNPAMKAKYGDTVSKIADLYRDLNSFGQKQSVLNTLLNAGDLVNAIEFAYARAIEQDKPAGERSPQFAEANVKRALSQLGANWGDREADAEIQALAKSLQTAGALPSNQKLAFVEELFTGKSGNDRAKAEAEFSKNAILNSSVKSFADVEKMMTMTATQMREANDPLIRLIGRAYDEVGPLARRVQQFNGAITKMRPEYVAGLLAMREASKKGLSYYPDANFTLRFTYGEVKGYKPRDAVTYDYQTSFAGVIQKDTGEEPFNVPAGLKDLFAKKDYGTYVEPRLNDVPVAFLLTTDITGGNSGSPVMNGRGEVIGLAFDGNYEGLGGDYSFDISSNRTIAVDIRYVLFVTEKFAGAGYLFNEMQIKRGKAMAAKK
ncbi:MAG: S46 family peptidase [Acidobacteria bacterium]|nr:S46 family peptidase [Acidobacteriota bacterium]